MKQQAKNLPQYNNGTTTNIEPHSDEGRTHRAGKKPRTPRSPRTPSQIQDDYWVSARARKNRVPFTERSGKWLIFVPLDELDDAWAKIKKATEAGLLGNSSKAATALSNPNAADPTKRVICVYTYDSDDREDVMRVRQALRDLGFDRPMPYKTDLATLEGRYQVRGHKRISLYYE
jgi:Domain of unknown function (DUF1917)